MNARVIPLFKDEPTPLPPDMRAVLFKYAHVMRGKIKATALARAMAGRKVSVHMEVKISRRLASEIRKWIDANTAAPVLQRARTAHVRGCLSTRVAAILGVSPYEAEVWANLSTPREQTHTTETEDTTDA